MVEIKPMLFNTEMVKAILDGRKTVTRRIIKPQPEGRLVLMGPDSCWAGYFAIEGTEKVVRPPLCAGDVIWVRETFHVDYLSNIIGSGRVRYKADGAYQDFSFAPERYDMMRRAQRKPGWRPNENMPKEAARIFLRVTDARVERLRDMSVDDVFKEGVFVKSTFEHIWDRWRLTWDDTIRPTYRQTYGFEANPWVWVIEFERCEKPEGWPC